MKILKKKFNLLIKFLKKFFRFVITTFKTMLSCIHKYLKKYCNIIQHCVINKYHKFVKLVDDIKYNCIKDIQFDKKDEKSIDYFIEYLKNSWGFNEDYVKEEIQNSPEMIKKYSPEHATLIYNLINNILKKCQYNQKKDI